MPEDVMVDKAKFDAVLQRFAQSKPTTLEQVKGKPKVGKDDTLNSGKNRLLDSLD